MESDLMNAEVSEVKTVTNDIFKEIEKSEKYVTESATYNEPKYYIEQFLSKMPVMPLELTGLATNKIEVVDNLHSYSHIAYPRYKIEARLSNVTIEGKDYQNIIGMIIALDLQMPRIKIYSGINASSCLNLHIFNAEHIYEESLTNANLNSWSMLNKFSDALEDKITSYSKEIEKLSYKEFDNYGVNQLLGSLLTDRSKDKVQSTIVVQASKLLTKRASDYYFTESTTGMNILGALTQSITDSPEITKGPEKTILVCNKLTSLINYN